MKGPQTSSSLSLAKQLSLLFALVLIFVVATTTEAMRWNKNAVKETVTASVADSGNVGRTIEFLAFNDGAVGFVPQFE
jgi:hypothetical protein